MFLSRRLIELKYKIAWYVGALLSFLLYFSGFVTLYTYLRRGYLKYPITIVLMYHRIGNNNTPDISVSTKNFDRQIAYLKRNFDIVSLDELVENYKHNYRLGKDIVAITFDDGYKDNYLNAYPILRNYNAPATIFLITNFIDKNPEMLNSKDILIMLNDKITFGAHTLNHKILSEIDHETAWLEISNSKFMLEEILQKKIKYFAYPKGKKKDYSEAIIQMVRDTGYEAAFSTENGCITNNTKNFFTLNRLGMRNYPLFVFKVRVSGIFESRLFIRFREYVRLT